MNNLNQNSAGEAGAMAPACISAIFGNSISPNGLRPGFLGENIFIHKNYVELRPFLPDMEKSKNTKAPEFKKFEDKTPKEKNRQCELHYTYKENRYDLGPDLNDYKIVDGKPDSGEPHT